MQRTGERGSLPTSESVTETRGKPPAPFTNPPGGLGWSSIYWVLHAAGIGADQVDQTLRVCVDKLVSWRYTAKQKDKIAL